MCLNMVLFCFISLTAASVNKLVVFIKFVETLAVINSSIFLPHFHPLILTFKFNCIDELILSYRFLKFTAVFAHVCTCMWGPEINTGCLTLWDNISHWTWSSLTQLGWPVSPRNLHFLSAGVAGAWYHTACLAYMLESWAHGLTYAANAFLSALSPRPSGNDPGSRHWAHLFVRTQRPSLLQVPSGLGFTISSFVSK